MAQNGRSVYQRIRSVKSSLDNAEQSFLDNNGMRGELDLMLAEAELKNLRHNKDVPWSWSRHMLAVGVAALLALAGLGGWYYAHGSIAVAGKNQTAEQVVPASLSKGKVSKSIETKNTIILPFGDQTINNVPAARQADYVQQVNITEADMRRLVQSARVELSNSK